MQKVEYKWPTSYKSSSFRKTEWEKIKEDKAIALNVSTMANSQLTEPSTLKVDDWKLQNKTSIENLEATQKPALS